MAISRSYPSCGLIRNPANGPEVVVTSLGTSEIFNLGSMSWREGPALSAVFDGAASAQLEDTFLLVGGYLRRDGGSGVELNTIYEFDQINYGWILRTQRLQLARDTPGVVALPRNALEC